jgi:flagellar hook-associated protein 1 FlgK
MANIIFGMFDVAKTALLTQQKALDVTSNNIANVNTEGYSRQELVMEQNEPVRYQGGTLSTGVHASQNIKRVYDQFLGAQIDNASSQQGRWDAQLDSLKKAELMFDDSSGYGLNDAMSKFWNSWQDLANNPSGYTEREALVSNAQNMTQVFNSMSKNLTQVQTDSDTSIKGSVNDVNSLTSDIASLNVKIIQVEAGNEHSANDFLDQRDQDLKQLSNLIDVNSIPNNDGSLTVTTAGGHTLVDAGNSWNLATGTNAKGFQDVYWESGNGTQTDITTDISTGKLKGWIEARDTTIPDYLNRLDDMAVTMANAVNAQQNNGLDLNGNPGQDFFAPTTGAGDIAVNPAVAGDTNLIAAAANTESVPGGNGNAVQMADIQNQLLMSGGTATIDDFYNGLVSDVGSNSSQAQTNSDHQSTVSDQLSTYREEVSGVNMDEEMINMVQYQSAYSAAAKLVTTVNRMCDTLISMVS